MVAAAKQTLGSRNQHSPHQSCTCRSRTLHHHRRSLNPRDVGMSWSKGPTASEDGVETVEKAAVVEKEEGPVATAAVVAWTPKMHRVR